MKKRILYSLKVNIFIKRIIKTHLHFRKSRFINRIDDDIERLENNAYSSSL